MSGLELLNALAPWQWGIVAAVPAGIVLLYFLKLRREPEIVSSTLLWQRTIEDLHVNQPFQWLRYNILLILQLLLIALLALACLRPALSRTKAGVRHFIILIDNSASMTATDVAPTRLEAAKEAAIQEVVDDLMDSDDLAMVIVFSDKAQVIASYTSNRAELRRKIRAIRPTHRSTDLREALRIATALANPDTVKTDDLLTDESGRPIGAVEPIRAQALLYSDGGFGSLPDASLGDLGLTFRPIGTNASNDGFVRFSVREIEGSTDTVQVFAEVRSFGGTPHAARVRLFWKDTLVGSQELQLGEQRPQPVAFQLPARPGLIRLELTGSDPLPLDNKVLAVLGEPRRARILLVTEGNRWLERALSTSEVERSAEIRTVSPKELTQPAIRNALRTGAYDLVISDGVDIPELPEANMLLFGTFPSDLRRARRHPTEWPAVIDTDHAHPLMQFVNLAALRIARAELINPPAGADVLARCAEGPLIWTRSRGFYVDCVVAFRLVENQTQLLTDWPVRISFPLFLMNALRLYGRTQASLVQAPLPPGLPIKLPLSLAPSGSLSLRLPDGTRQALKKLRDAWVFIATDQVGLYRVEKNGEALREIPVALQDARESDIRVRERAQIGSRELIAADRRVRLRRELWPWFAAAALLVCLAEWYIYNRRIAL